MPRELQERYYELKEASKATGIPRGSLDHACRNGRLPHTRSERGSRLISETTVRKLKKQGLAAFPRPYIDPSPQEDPSEQVSGTSQGRPSPAERIGLLDKPSAEMVKAKETAETAKLNAEEGEARLRSARSAAELQQLRRQQQEEQNAREQADREQEDFEREEREQRRREQAQLSRQQIEETRKEQRLRQWVKEQFKLLMAEAYPEIHLRASVPFGKMKEAEDALLHRLGQELVAKNLGPGSSSSACAYARERALNKVLLPYRCQHLLDHLSVDAEIFLHLLSLHAGGYTELSQSNMRFLAAKWSPTIRDEIRQQFFRSGGLDEQEAKKLIRTLVEQRL